jgi:capping protein (actin filament) muscle Z-line, alpha
MISYYLKISCSPVVVFLVSSSYDHLRKEASQCRPAPEPDRKVEQWRCALESEFTLYVKNYYKFGVSTVYGSFTGDGILLTACIESHQFSPKNFW